jgi:hypothetical protein
VSFGPQKRKNQVPLEKEDLNKMIYEDIELVKLKCFVRNLIQVVQNIKEHTVWTTF